MARLLIVILLLTLRGHADPPELVPQSPLDGGASSMSVSPDGRYLAAWGRRASLWDVDRGYATADLGKLDDPWTWGTGRAAALGPRGEVVVLRVPDGKRILTLKLQRGRSQITALGLSPDDIWLALGRADGGLELWDLRVNRAVAAQPEAHLNSVNCCCFSGGCLWTGSADGSARRWQLPDLDPNGLLRHYRTGVQNVIIRAGVVYTQTDDVVTSWDEASLHRLGRFRWKEGSFQPRWAFAADGSLLQEGQARGHGFILTYRDGRGTLRDLGKYRYVYAFTPDGASYFTEHEDRLEKRSVADDRLLTMLDNRANGCVTLTLDPSGSRMTTQSAGENIPGAGVWDLRTGCLVNSLSWGRYELSDLATDTDCRLVAVAERELTSLRDLNSGEVLLSRPQARAHVRFARSGQLLIANDLVDPTSGRVVRTFPGRPTLSGDQVLAEEERRLRVFPLSRESPREYRLPGAGRLLWFYSDQLAYLEDDDRLIRWNPSTGTTAGMPPLPPPGDHPGYLGNALSPDGAWALVGGETWPTYLLRTADWKMQELTVNGADILVFSHDSRRFAVGAEDLSVWTTEGRLVARFPVSEPPDGLAFTPDGRHLFTATQDLWRLYDLTTATHVLTGLSFRFSNDWAVLAPDGRYDGTPDGLRRAVVCENGSVGTLAERDWHLFESGLLGRLLR